MTDVALRRPGSMNVVAVVREALDARAAAAVLGFVAVVSLGTFDGGYFPTSWGWAALGFSWVALLALVLRRAPSLPKWGGVWLACLVLFGVCVAASTVWSADETRSILETERLFAYVAAATAVLLVVRRATIPHLLGGMLAGITAVSAYALATRLFPERLGAFDPVSGYRLSEPVGYWNVLGLLAAMGALLALGFVARARTIWGAGLAAAVLVVLAPTIYFTFGRGPWVALASGFVIAVALDLRRVQLVVSALVAAPLPAVAVVLASRSDALTHLGAALEDASREGHGLALTLAVLAVSNAAVVVAYALVARRVVVPRVLHRAAAVVLVLLAAGALALVFARFGGPVTLTRDAVHAFKQSGSPAMENDLNQRLFSFSGTGRADLWRAAWRGYEEDKVLGTGAGTYEQSWHRYREVGNQNRDAHNLYLETLSELGPAGLTLLAAVLLIPFAAALRGRSAGITVGALGAYTAYVVHASVDWDWEMPVVTVAALFSGTALLAAAPGDRRPLGREARLSLGATVAAFATAALIGLIGNSAVSASEDAARDGDWPKAVAEARKAASWAPWSSEPWRVRGEAELGRGNLGEAASSFRTALGSSPEDWQLWFQLALSTSGREHDQALRRAEKLNPLSPQLREYRAARDQLP
jgi:O-antigen ligase